MKERAGGGKMINIGSMMSLFGAPYAVAVCGKQGWHRADDPGFGHRLGEADNIQVNAVLPGWIDTELTRGARQQVQGLHQRVLDRTPAGRWGLPDDLAGIAAFLAGPGSDFITGAAIPVDGGFSVVI